MSLSAAKWKRLTEAAIAHTSDPWAYLDLEHHAAERVRRIKYHIPYNILSSPDEHGPGVCRIESKEDIAGADPELLPLDEDLESMLQHCGDNASISGAHWIVDEAIVKIEKQPFASGAMRNCYRMKKIPQNPHAGKGTHALNWKKANNYVAKDYKPDHGSERKQYFLDVRLQTEAAYWARLFNESNPPKKIDMIHVFIVEFLDREDHPLFCVERFIDGPYIKHNSNSGYLENHHKRLTPQFFSHFTFLKSSGLCMVVDIQGVDDLYTDPQIHTHNCRFGGGDIGFRGMALFFASHTCNALCQLFELPNIKSSISDFVKLRPGFEVTPVDTTTTSEGNVHFQMAALYAEDRITLPSGSITKEALILSYLHQSAIRRNGAALELLARLYSNQFAEDLSDILVETVAQMRDSFFTSDVLEEDLKVSYQLWKLAAECDVPEGMVHLALALESTGDESTLYQVTTDWASALKLYQRIQSIYKNDMPLSMPMYEVLRHQAEMLSIGGYGLTKDVDYARELFFDAGTIAMQAGNMFLGNQCFRKAESLE